MKENTKCPSCGIVYRSKMFIYGTTDELTFYACPVCDCNWTEKKSKQQEKTQ